MQKPSRHIGNGIKLSRNAIERNANVPGPGFMRIYESVRNKKQKEYGLYFHDGIIP